MTFLFGDIILVEVMFTNMAGKKLRPAVVVSSNRYNKKRQDLIFMPITGQLKGKDTFGTIEIIDWKKCNLAKPSVVKPVLQTVLANRVRKKLGKADKKTREAIIAGFSDLLG